MTVKRKTKGTFKYIQGLNFINAYILNSYTQEVHFSNNSKGVLIVIVSTETNCEVKVEIHHHHVVTPNNTWLLFFFTRLTILLTLTHTRIHTLLVKLKGKKVETQLDAYLV